MDRIFANVMAYFRQKAGLSQQTVSIKTGIAQSELSKLEEGTHWPNKKTVSTFCKGFNVSGNDFFLFMGLTMIFTALSNEIWLDDDEEEKKKENERNNKHK